MSDLYDRIVSQHGRLENILSKIPGYRGYKDMEARRAADDLLRDHIASALGQRINRFAQIEKDLLDADGFSFMSKTNSARSKMQRFRSRVEAAAPGYSGPFAKIKLGPDDLEKLYSFDEALIRYADQFDEALSAFAQAVTSQSGIREAIEQVDNLADEANEALSLREDVITNLGKSL